jgi:hypothetical protein
MIHQLNELLGVVGVLGHNARPPRAPARMRRGRPQRPAATRKNLLSGIPSARGLLDPSPVVEKAYGKFEIPGPIVPLNKRETDGPTATTRWSVVRLPVPPPNQLFATAIILIFILAISSPPSPPSCCKSNRCVDATGRYKASPSGRVGRRPPSVPPHCVWVVSKSIKHRFYDRTTEIRVSVSRPNPRRMRTPPPQLRCINRKEERQKARSRQRQPLSSSLALD